MRFFQFQFYGISLYLFFSLIVYVYFLVSHSAINIQRWLTDPLFCRLFQVRNCPPVILVHTWVFLSCHSLCNLFSLLLPQVLYLFLHHFTCISFLCILLLLPLDTNCLLPPPKPPFSASLLSLNYIHAFVYV